MTLLADGATYFAALLRVVSAAPAGARLCFTDWRADADQLLTDDGPRLADLLGAAAERGVDVRGLMWRGHPSRTGMPGDQNRVLVARLRERGAEVLLDERVRLGGSHHQKVLLVRHPGAPERDVAFVGGIDLCHSRRDDAAHRGDPQPMVMAEVYGPRPAWHDVQVQVQVRGPAVGAIERTFRERWEDPAPLTGSAAWAGPLSRAARLGTPPDGVADTPPGAPLLPALSDPQPVGTVAVQVLRTYPRRRRHPYPFAPRGERSVARAHTKALARVRRLIYLENQYFWAPEVAGVFRAALRREPDLQLVLIMPRYPDQDGALSEAPNLVGREDGIQWLRDSAPEQVHVFDLESAAGLPVYVHAKLCVVDDVWCSVGSDNLNLRSWTLDSEITCAMVDTQRDKRAPRDPGGQGDGARRFARETRVRLCAEHLGRAVGAGSAVDDTGLLDPRALVATLRACADGLQGWYDGGKRGPRPPGHLRHHPPITVPQRTRLWARPLWKHVYDPDARPRVDRRTLRF